VASPEIQDRASQVVLALLGGRWTWPPVNVVETYHAPAGRINLTGRPATVTRVLSLRYGEDVTDRVAVYNGAFLILPGRSCGGVRGCSFTGGCYEVEYFYGSEPPEPIMAAIAALADQLELADQDLPCKLPERVTSVNRQGMSWTLLDPMDFLEKGRTGIPEVDLVLSVYNPARAKARARVFTPDFPPGVRHNPQGVQHGYR